MNIENLIIRTENIANMIKEVFFVFFGSYETHKFGCYFVNLDYIEDAPVYQ